MRDFGRSAGHGWSRMPTDRKNGSGSGAIAAGGDEEVRTLFVKYSMPKSVRSALPVLRLRGLCWRTSVQPAAERSLAEVAQEKFIILREARKDVFQE